jgi:hypothetical protein
MVEAIDPSVQQAKAAAVKICAGRLFTCGVTRIDTTQVAATILNIMRSNQIPE